MKLTWFGGTTLRIHIGGQILVSDPAYAPAAVEEAELVSGANRTFGRTQRHSRLRRAAERGRRDGRRADDLRHPDGDEEAADVVTDGGKADDIVANAPATEENFFLVPKVVE
jgi:L-ascorbate metabolism protein UlaG (beta-lactamase superfamily)